MKRPVSILVIFFCLAASCSPQQNAGVVLAGADGTQWLPMRVERLPDLNVPRGNHRTFVIGDEIVVMGGNTDGFKPVETAEYYSGGSWHTVHMMYPHLNGFAAPLPDGRILLGGGSQEAFGIGQSWGAEVYDPASHSFTSVGIMSVRRAMSSALTMPDGSVVIAGNWHAEDSYETWTPEGGFVPGGALRPGWGEPFILPASPDDIIVFGEWDTVGNKPGGRVDHLGGEPEQVPLLEGLTFYANYYMSPEDLQIADYTYLISTIDSSTKEFTILRLASGQFSILEMETPLPARTPEGHPIGWGHIQADRPERAIWAQGMDTETGNLFFARIGYDATFDGGKATATLYYAETPGGFCCNAAKLLPGNRFVLAGGTGWKEGTIPVEGDFFKTTQTAYLLHTEPLEKTGFPLWAILAILFAAAAGAVVAVLLIRRQSKGEEEPAPAEEGKLSRNFMEQISALIEEKELYRRKNLRINDVATELATNKTYVSVMLNNMSGESFSSLITRHRVAYACKLLREHPEMILDEVADESGFSSRTTFFRSFKALTGMTPAEWKKGGRS